MIETLSEYAWVILAGMIGVQILLIAVPSLFYMIFSANKNALVLGCLTGGVHLSAVAIVAALSGLSPNPDMKLAWLAISMMDLPVTFLFPAVERVFSMEGFFTVFGTVQYALSGLAIGCIWRRVRGDNLFILLLPLLMAGPVAQAAGPCTHIEMGRRAFDQYLVPGEMMVPGFAALRSDDATMRAFYSGCTFPDFGQDGVNGEASEAAHWHPFEKEYFAYVRETFPPPWTGETAQHVAFFLGILCHNTGDWAWHFDYGGHKSVMTKAKEEGLRALDRVGEVFAHMFYTVRPGISGKFWWPYTDVLKVFSRAGVSCSMDDLIAGCPSQDAGWKLGAVFAPIAYPVFSARWPWTRRHMDGYYYGGVDHSAALCAMTMRYHFARLEGARVYQNIPVESVAFPKGQPFLPMTDSGGWPFLIFNTASGGDVTITVTGLAPPESGEIKEAVLWMHFAGRGPQRQIDSISISAVAPVGPAARVAVLPTDQPGKWFAWDITPQAQAGVQHQGPCAIRLESERLEGQPELRFDSSAALRENDDDFSGTRVAYRPLVVVR